MAAIIAFIHIKAIIQIQPTDDWNGTAEIYGRKCELVLDRFPYA